MSEYMTREQARQIVKESLSFYNGPKYDQVVDNLDFNPKDFRTGYENYRMLHGLYCFYHSEGYIILSIDTVKHIITTLNTNLISMEYNRLTGGNGRRMEKIQYDIQISLRDIKLNHIFTD